MTKKEAFIEFVNMLMTEAWPDVDSEERGREEWADALEFFNDFKNGKVKNSGKMTENGLKVLSWMQENVENMTNVFTSKEIAEGLFTTGRSVAGSMRKLVNEGFVEKIGKDPVQYALTEAGKNFTN